MKLSIVAPMYNESDNLVNTLEALKAEMAKNPDWDYEMVFVNDGSKDDTWGKAKALAENEPRLRVVGYPVNQGRGRALRYGFEHAEGDIITSIDFDLTYDATHITRMVQELLDNPTLDLVLASCYMPGGKTIGVPPFRLFISKMANLLYEYAFTPKVYTSTCVVRAYRREVIDSLLLESDDKEIHLEIISKALSNGFKLKEIPGTLTRRQAGKSKFKFASTSISHLIYLIQERPFLLFGMLGVVLMFLGFIAAGILFYTRFGGNEAFEHTFISRIASPNFVIILFVAGFQILGLGFLGIQNNILKREIFKMQRQIKKMGKD